MSKTLAIRGARRMRTRSCRITFRAWKLRAVCCALLPVLVTVWLPETLSRYCILIMCYTGAVHPDTNSVLPGKLVLALSDRMVVAGSRYSGL
jgi:hypothetical protein